MSTPKDSRDLKSVKRALSTLFTQNVVDMTFEEAPPRLVKYDTDNHLLEQAAKQVQSDMDAYGDANRAVRRSDDTSLALSRRAVLLNQSVPSSQLASRMWARALHAVRCYERLCELDAALRTLSDGTRPKHHEYVRWLRDYRVPVLMVRRNATAHHTWLSDPHRNTVHFGGMPDMPHAAGGLFASDKSTANALLYEIVYVDMIDLIALCLHSTAHVGTMVEWGPDGTLPTCDEFDKVPDANGAVFRWNERTAEAARHMSSSSSKRHTTPRTYVRERFSESRVRVFDTYVRFNVASVMRGQAQKMRVRRERQEHVVRTIEQRLRDGTGADADAALLTKAQRELDALRAASAVAFEHDPDVPVGDLGGSLSDSLQFDAHYMHYRTVREAHLSDRDAYAQAKQLLTGANDADDDAECGNAWIGLFPSFEQVTAMVKGCDDDDGASVYAYVSACAQIMLGDDASVLPPRAIVKTLRMWLKRRQRTQRTSPNFRAFAADTIERVDAWLSKVLNAVQQSAWQSAADCFPSVLVQRSRDELSATAATVESVALRYAAPSRRLWQHVPPHDARVQNVFSEADAGRSTYVESTERLQYDDAFLAGAHNAAPIRGERDEQDHERHLSILSTARIDPVRDFVNPVALSQHFRQHICPVASSTAAVLHRPALREDTVPIVIDEHNRKAATRWAQCVLDHEASIEWPDSTGHCNAELVHQSSDVATDVLLDRLVTIVAEPFCEGRELRTECPGVRNRVDTTMSHERFEDTVTRVRDNNAYWSFFGHVSRLLLGGQPLSMHDFCDLVDGKKAYERDERQRQRNDAEQQRIATERSSEVYAFVARIADTYRQLYPDHAGNSGCVALLNGLRLRDGARLLNERLQRAEAILCHVPWMRRAHVHGLGTTHVYSCAYDYAVNAALTHVPVLDAYNAALTEHARRLALATSWRRAGCTAAEALAKAEERRLRHKPADMDMVAHDPDVPSSALRVLRDEVHASSLCHFETLEHLDWGDARTLIALLDTEVLPPPTKRRRTETPHELRPDAVRQAVVQLVQRIAQRAQRLRRVSLPVVAGARISPCFAPLLALETVAEVVFVFHVTSTSTSVQSADEPLVRCGAHVHCVTIRLPRDVPVVVDNFSQWFADASSVHTMFIEAQSNSASRALTQSVSHTPLTSLANFGIVHTHWSHFTHVKQLTVRHYGYCDALALALAVDALMWQPLHGATGPPCRVERTLCIEEDPAFLVEAGDAAVDVAALRHMHVRALAQGFCYGDAEQVRLGDAYLAPCSAESIRRRRAALCVRTWSRTATWLREQKQRYKPTLKVLGQFLLEWRRRAEAIRAYDTETNRAGLQAPPSLPAPILPYVWRRNDVLEYLSQCSNYDPSMCSLVQTIERLEWHWATDATALDPLGGALWSNGCQVARSLGEYVEPTLSLEWDDNYAREGLVRFYNGVVVRLLAQHQRHVKL